MAELRRLLIAPQRLRELNPAERNLPLLGEENHYIRRVLRLGPGQSIELTDGEGSLWEATLNKEKELRLSSSVNEPITTQSRPSPQLGLAVVVARRGMDEVMRMGCELGIDQFQPLYSARSTPQADDRSSRWQTILREAVEQSERLWSPDLLVVEQLSSWLQTKHQTKNVAVATTRRKNLPDLQNWLEALSDPSEPIWVLIGPEGGWTADEESKAGQAGCQAIHLGDLILRTATAAVAAAQTMVRWRGSIPTSSGAGNCQGKEFSAAGQDAMD